MSAELKRLLTVLVMLAAAPTGHAQRCADPAAPVVAVEVDPTRVIRAGVPPSLFGFNLPWRDFQGGFLRDGHVRPDLVELLKPFKGAVYRYPGGTPSNTFVWRQALGPLSAREPVVADYGRRARVDFGLPEFADFLVAVDGQALLTANLVGDERQKIGPDEVRENAKDFMRLLQQVPGLACVSGSACRLFAIELGNELDRPPMNLDAGQYLQRATAFLDGALAEPGAGSIPWIALGRSSPWDTRASDYDDFNRRVMSGLGKRVAGLAFHPYYDGIVVSDALKFVQRFGDAAREAGPNAGLYITEHGRWPAVPKVGRWEDNWYQTTSVGGALASADFILGLMDQAQVKVANWHALSAAGPWQLVRRAQDGERLVPTVLYWGLRVLREGMLDDVVAINYRPTRGAYGGGYDQRMVAVRSANGRRTAILGVNRAERSVTLQIKGWSAPASGQPGRVRSVSGPSLDFRNERAGATQAGISAQALMPGAVLEACVPARAIFAVENTP